MAELEKTQIEVARGQVWTIYKRGNEVCIVDPDGRHRHGSRGQANTAIFLAMKMAEKPLPAESNADQALRQIADRFINGELPKGNPDSDTVGEMIHQAGLLSPDERERLLTALNGE